MKRVRLLTASLLGVGLLAASAFAQNNPAPTPHQPEPPTPPIIHEESAATSPELDATRQQIQAEVARLRAQAEALQKQMESLRTKTERESNVTIVRPGMGGMGGMMRGMGGGMGGGVGAMGGMGGVVTAPYPTPPFQEQLERMRSWLDTVDRYTRLARNPSDTGVAAVITANDLLRARGPKGAIEFFNKVLPEVKNDAVRRTIQLQMVELYKATGQQDKAIEELQTLITSAPAMPAMPSMPAMPEMAPMHGMMPGMMMPHAPTPPTPRQPSAPPATPGHEQ